VKTKGAVKALSPQRMGGEGCISELVIYPRKAPQAQEFKSIGSNVAATHREQIYCSLGGKINS